MGRRGQIDSVGPDEWFLRANQVIASRGRLSSGQGVVPSSGDRGGGSVKEASPSSNVQIGDYQVLPIFKLIEEITDPTQNLQTSRFSGKAEAQMRGERGSIDQDGGNGYLVLANLEEKNTFLNDGLDMAIDGVSNQEEPEDLGNNSGSGLKAKTLAREGMKRGGGSNFVGSRSNDRSNGNVPLSYANMLRGFGDDKGSDSESSSDFDVDTKLNTTIEGETVRCEFEKEHYEGIVNCFKDSTILVHFLGRPPNEVELRKWLQELWSDRGWYID